MATLACLVLAISTFTACDWDTSPEYDHPTYVTYTISASNDQFEGPEQVLSDIQVWLDKNQMAYDVKLDYKTGEASEFANADTEALKKYGEFKPKFQAFLNEMSSKIASGTYGKDAKVNARFNVYVYRAQGQDRTLKSEFIHWSYPSN